MKCLVVDDSTTMRRIVTNALKGIGYSETIEARDGIEALNKCDESIDIIIADWNMPDMGGLDLVKKLRAGEKTSKIPILMLTTRSVNEDILRAVEAGINGYIVKPFTPQILEEKIEEVRARVSA